jgi:hypothetical protein
LRHRRRRTLRQYRRHEFTEIPWARILAELAVFGMDFRPGRLPDPEEMALQSYLLIPESKLPLTCGVLLFRRVFSEQLIDSGGDLLEGLVLFIGVEFLDDPAGPDDFVGGVIDEVELEGSLGHGFAGRAAAG